MEVNPFGVPVVSQFYFTTTAATEKIDIALVGFGNVARRFVPGVHAEIMRHYPNLIANMRRILVSFRPSKR